jgi:hypothetical protein
MSGWMKPGVNGCELFSGGSSTTETVQLPVDDADDQTEDVKTEVTASSAHEPPDYVEDYGTDDLGPRAGTGRSGRQQRRRLL